MKYLSQIDTSGIPTKGLTPETGTAFPADPWEGRFFHRTDLKALYIYSNGAWQRCDNNGVAAAVHIHAIADVTGLQAALDAKSAVGHTHDDRYYTQGQVDSKLSAVTIPAATDTVAGKVELATTLETQARTDTVRAVTPAGVAYAILTKADKVHTHAVSDVTGLQTTLTNLQNNVDLANDNAQIYADETQQGQVRFATTTEATNGATSDGTKKAVTPAGVKAAINALINGAPGALDTLQELAAAMGNDANFRTTILNAIAAKADTNHSHDLGGSQITGVLPIAKGGTGGNTATSARQNISATTFFTVPVPALVSGSWTAIQVSAAYMISDAEFFLLAGSEKVEIDWRLSSTRSDTVEVRPHVAVAASTLNMTVTAV